MTPELISDFLAPLEISDLHGFGWSTKQKALEKLGATTLGELAKKSKGTLIDALGKTTGETLYNAVRGIDEKHLESDKPRKSVSCEINVSRILFLRFRQCMIPIQYGIRFENHEQVKAFIHQMAAEVKRRMDSIGMVGRSVTLKVMKRDPTAPVEPPKVRDIIFPCYPLEKLMAYSSSFWAMELVISSTNKLHYLDLEEMPLVTTKSSQTTLGDF